MKKTTLLGLAALIVLASAITLSVAEDAKALPAGQVRADFNVEGMTCGSCCVSVETAVKKLDGIVDVKADYKKGMATVTYVEEKVDLESIVKAVNENTNFKASVSKKA